MDNALFFILSTCKIFFLCVQEAVLLQGKNYDIPVMRGGSKLVDYELPCGGDKAFHKLVLDLYLEI